jgi:hypothetical protein
MGALTVTQRFFETRPKLFIVWMSAWVLPLSVIFFGFWICAHAARFPRMIWTYGLRDWFADAGDDFRRTMIIMPMAWWLAFTKSLRASESAPDIPPD